MSLDKNLFTLNITPREKEPNVVELIDPSNTVHYRKERVDGTVYSFNVYGMSKLAAELMNFIMMFTLQILFLSRCWPA